jgi:hypothetical protein
MAKTAGVETPGISKCQHWFKATHSVKSRRSFTRRLCWVKLFALPSLYRQGQLEKSLRYEADIAILYKVTRPNVEPLFETLKPILTEAQLIDVKNIVGEIQQRIAKLDRAKKPEPDSQ